MKGYTIHDVPTVHVDEDSKSSLEGTDSTQELLMSEAVIAVTESDEIIGPILNSKATTVLANITERLAYYYLIQAAVYYFKKELVTK